MVAFTPVPFHIAAVKTLQSIKLLLKNDEVILISKITTI